MQIKARTDFAEVRIKKGYSLTGLAKEMKVNPSVVFHLERGNSVRPATAKKVCEALNEPFENLFTIERQHLLTKEKKYEYQNFEEVL